MNNNDYIIRRAVSPDDGKKLNELFTTVFYPEEVGIFAETFFNHLPGTEYKYWFIAEEKKSSNIVAGFTLIPWTWELDGIKLKVAELGIVGTLKEHRCKGLMRLLNKEFEKTFMEDGFDLSIIQGIPGFYNQLGYYYSIPLDIHINVPFHIIKDFNEAGFTFRKAGQEDIPFLIEEDTHYRDRYFISSYRNEINWEFIFTEVRKTECASEIWIMNDNKNNNQYYFRIQFFGFGQGLIINEISERISFNAMESLLSFCKNLAIERKKPYIRLNLSENSMAGKMAISMGAQKDSSYAWQVKFADVEKFLVKIASVLEKRIENSLFRFFSETITLDFYKRRLDLIWDNGKLNSINPGQGEAKNLFSISNDLFPALCLGYRSWQELQYTRPDVYFSSNNIGILIDILFPKRESWIYSQY